MGTKLKVNKPTHKNHVYKKKCVSATECAYSIFKPVKYCKSAKNFTPYLVMKFTYMLE